MSDENKLTILLMVITLLLVVMLYSCTYKEPVDSITKNAIDICGCDRTCVLRMVHIKGALNIKESEYKKHCK